MGDGSVVGRRYCECGEGSVAELETGMGSGCD